MSGPASPGSLSIYTIGFPPKADPPLAGWVLAPQYNKLVTGSGAPYYDSHAFVKYGTSSGDQPYYCSELGSGSGAVVAHSLWERGVAGSNPVSPTLIQNPSN